jgi:alkylation response protein AidB-like acyl-CoA dehydrogenase
MDLSATPEQARWKSRAQEALRCRARHAGDEPSPSAEPAELLRELASAGVLGLGVPERLGGAGEDAVALILAVEEVARYDTSLAAAWISHAICAAKVADAGSPEQHERWLPALLAGLRLGAWAGEEGSALEALPGEGASWRVSGRAGLIPNAMAAELFVLHLAAGRDEHAVGTACLIDASAAGVHVRPQATAGMRHAGLGELQLADCLVPAGNVLQGSSNDAPRSLRVPCLARVALAAVACGTGRGVLEDLAVALGGSAQAAGQGVQWLLADAATELDAAWLLTLRAAAASSSPERAEITAAMAKLTAGRACGRAATAALQSLGTAALEAGAPFEVRLQDSKFCELALGTEREQLLRVARDLPAGAHLWS